MMENNFYDGSVTAGIVPNTHFFQEVEVVYKPVMLFFISKNFLNLLCPIMKKFG